MHVEDADADADARLQLLHVKRCQKKDDRNRPGSSAMEEAIGGGRFGIRGLCLGGVDCFGWRV